MSFNRLLQTWGGITICVPPGQSPDLARRMAWMALGGPITSLLFAAATIPLLQLVHGPAKAVLAAFALCCAGIFAVTSFMPSVGSGMKSDGARARGLLRNDAATVCEAALVALTGLSMAEVDPRQWPPDLVIKVRESRYPGAYQVSADLLLVSHDLSREGSASSRDRLVSAIHESANLELLAPIVASDAALFELVVRRDPRAAEPWIVKATSSPFVERYRLAMLRGLKAAAVDDRATLMLETDIASASLGSARFGVASLDRRILEELRAVNLTDHAQRLWSAPASLRALPDDQPGCSPPHRHRLARDQGPPAPCLRRTRIGPTIRGYETGARALWCRGGPS